MKTRQSGCDTPSAIPSRKGIVRYGGASRIGPLRGQHKNAPNLRGVGRISSYSCLACGSWSSEKTRARGVERAMLGGRKRQMVKCRVPRPQRRIGCKLGRMALTRETPYNPETGTNLLWYSDFDLSRPILTLIPHQLCLN